MTDKSREEIQAFAQKMQKEGAAGFAAGLTPWDSWDDFEGQAGSRQVWQGTTEHITGPGKPPRSFGDRVLATMTVLAIATLVIGTTGVFLTQQPALQIAENNAQLSSSPATTAEIQLPPEENLIFRGVSMPATPASPAADFITEIDMAVGPSADLSRDQYDSPALPAILAEGDNRLTALNVLPAPAAGMAYQPSTTASEATLETAIEPEIETAVEPAVEAAIEPAIEPAGEIADQIAIETVTDEPVEIQEMNMAEAEMTTPVLSVDLSGTSMTDADTELLQTGTPDISENEKMVSNGGDWSINIASYLRDSTAEKMQQRFLDEGVATDLVTATVRGKTYYRLRVTGFDSREEATAHSTTIKQLLGLDELWITKE